jgi:hypothetical protein
MPKSDADYSNTIIYKITCNDAQVTDVYVGHTTNFVQRKHAHRLNCVNNNCKVYKVIRANGGWTNWSMDIINFFKCKDQYEARIKEQEYFLLLNATLNSVEPFHTPVIKAIVDKTLFFCEPCNIQFDSQKMLDVHCNTRKHKKQVLTPEDLMEGTQHVVKFHCNICHFHCSKQSNYAMHLLTQKHIFNTSLTKRKTEDELFECKLCNKTYISRVGLWYHSKKCIEPEITPTPPLDKTTQDIEDLKNLVLEMVKTHSEQQQKNIELQKQLLDICKKKSWSAE